jgi:histidyl-tRNA synthetase
MGGPQTSGVGWASGVDRLALLLEKKKSELIPTSKKIAIIIADELATETAMKLGQDLRDHDFEVEIPFSGNVGKRFKRADKIGAQWALVLGSTELSQNSATIKNLKTGEQKLVPRDQIFNALL